MISRTNFIIQERINLDFKGSMDVEISLKHNEIERFMDHEVQKFN